MNGDSNFIHELKITETSEKEAAQVIEYMKIILSETNYLSMEPEEFSYSEDDEREVIKKYLKTPNSLMLSAKLNGKLIGMLTYDGGSRQRTQHSGVVGVSVLKQYWGNNIATQLFKYLFDWAKQNGITKKINLSVREDNDRAINLYSRLGFEAEGKESMKQYTNGIYYASILMGKKI